MNIATAAEWKTHVYRYRGPGVSNGVRVLLLYLADNMRRNRMVSVPRSTIARDLGISTAEVTKRMKAAKDAGLLDPVRRGRPGVTAVYQGLFPSPVRGTGNPTSGGTPGLPSDTAQHGMGNHTSKRGFRGYPGVSATVNKRSESKAVVLGTTAEGSTTTAPRQSREVFFEEDVPSPSIVMSDGVDHRETRRAPIDALQASTLDMDGNDMVNVVDRETRRAPIDALQASTLDMDGNDMVNVVDRETRRALLDALQASAASDTHINEDTVDLLNKVADGLGDWATWNWTVPPAAATNRYLAGKQLNMILATWEAAA